MTDLSEGTVFAGHRIEGLAGRGGMGVVYRATQLSLERLVALKLIAPALAEDPDFRARFIRESKLAASIEHPNVIPIYYAGERDGRLFIAMRFVDGQDLRALIRAGGPLEPARAAGIVGQVAAALDAAHARGLVHRDVKPANVLLGPADHAYLTDFGLTKRVSGESMLAETDPSTGQGWVGTLGYVSPEQIRGERVDARADVYALGCVLVHALTGKAPFVREGDEATLWAHLNDEPPGEAAGVPPAFVPVVRRALAKHADDRFPSAGDLSRAALAAAGMRRAAEPERSVGVGEAAPTEETRPTPEQEQVGGAVGWTAPTAPVGPAGAAAPARHSARSRRSGAAVAVAVAIAVALFAALGSDEERPSPAPAPTAPAADEADGPRVVVEAPVGPRPNTLTLGGGSAWVGSDAGGDVLRLDAETGERQGRLDAGEGITAVHADYGFVWVVKRTTGSLLRFDVQTGGRRGVTTGLGGEPYAVDSGAGAVWVGVRRGAAGPDSVVKLNRRTGEVTARIPVEGGVRDLAVGGGAVWVTNRFTATLTRIETATGEQDRVGVGAGALGVSVDDGTVWVANADEESLTRVDARTLERGFVDLPTPPTQVYARAGTVWVTSQRAGSVLPVDARSGESGEPVPVGRGAFALSVREGYLWVTVLGDGTAKRIAFPERAEGT